ncbi:MAG: FAD:protein FMN transferase [Acidobacteriota bacterium]
MTSLTAHGSGGGRVPARFAGLALTALALLASAGCQRGVEPAPRLLYSLQGATFGTYYVVKIVVDRGDIVEGEPSPEERALPLIEHELAEVDRLMSNYRDDSELSEFNANPTSDPVPLSPPTVEVFKAALELGELTAGALDVTLAPLVKAWGFGPDGLATTAPAADELEALLASVGIDKLTLDPAAGTLSKSDPNLYCDLSSLAKGYGVDRVLDRLRETGFSNVLVEIGGEVRTAGHNRDGEPWRLGIESPFALRGQVQRVLPLVDEALATSGDYRNYREIDGRRVSHLIDPRNGQPIEHQVASVSVVAPSCIRADALATALMVMGEEEGFDLAEREGVAALFLIRDGDAFVEKATTQFRARFPASSQAAAP